MTAAEKRHALVFGATGFLGRWLIVELAAQGVPVTAAVRSPESADQLAAWLTAHGVPGGVPSVLVDFDAPQLGVDPASLPAVTEIHNLAGAFRFGMSVDEARRGNVRSAEDIVRLASLLPGPPRLVHVSGYRVAGRGFTESAYAELGAYEGSKKEADAVVQSTAAELGVPFTIVNPSTVSGVSTTGESDQQIGIAASLNDLWHGRLAALPGNESTFVPVVTVDHLAKFMALVPTIPEAADSSYWVLDDNTPPLPELLASVGRHYQVRVPRLRIPVGLVKRLPASVTRADRETLSFMSEERYPTEPARELARRHGLEEPATLPAIHRWADHLAAHRFGQVPDVGSARGFATYAGVHTFGIGDPDARTIVLPAIPVNADTWADVESGLSEPARVLDLPGLGMSAGSEHDWQAWLDAVADGRNDLHLVGHSIGAAVVTEYAAAHPERVGRLTLVAPAFLQQPGGLSRRLSLLTALFLRFSNAAGLSRTLLGTDKYAAALETSVVDLRRPGTARRVGRLLARGASRRRREHVRQLLLAYPGEVHIVVGEHDPLLDVALGDRVRVTTIPGAGHYPQITHRAELITAIEVPTPVDAWRGTGRQAGSALGEERGSEPAAYDSPQLVRGSRR